MPKLYHISTDLSHTGHFTPRVPTIRYHVEDQSVPRVAVATSIAKCLSSLPGGGVNLEELLDDTFGFVNVFEIDTDDLAITPARIITPETLFANGIVGDAQHTLEHWLLDEITVPLAKQYLVHINNWDEQNIDVIPKWIQDIGDKHCDGNWHSAYRDIYNDDVPFSTEIVNLDYQSARLKTGETLDVFYMQYYDMAIISDYITTHNMPLTVESTFLTATDNVDITPIINDHYRKAFGLY